MNVIFESGVSLSFHPSSQTWALKIQNRHCLAIAFLFFPSFSFSFFLQEANGRESHQSRPSSSILIASKCLIINILNINYFVIFHFDFFFFNGQVLKVVPMCICKQTGNGLEYTIPWCKKPGLAVMLLIWTCRGFRNIHRSAPVITIPQVALEETFA